MDDGRRLEGRREEEEEIGASRNGQKAIRERRVSGGCTANRTSEKASTEAVKEGSKLAQCQMF